VVETLDETGVAAPVGTTLMEDVTKLVLPRDRTEVFQ
jgi:hypothetical protein